MINEALRLIQLELIEFLQANGENINVTIDNIGLFETTNSDGLNDSIVITVVNIEEESTLKNNSPLKRPFQNTAVYENPPVYLNLYVLFSCNYYGIRYVDALRSLYLVIRFLQGKNSFSVSSSVSAGGFTFTEPDIAQLKFTMELYTLTFEQINHLWGSLGGRQMPFAMYKLRLVAITERVQVREVPLIEEIETTAHPLS